jgi:hypothetical protein
MKLVMYIMPSEVILMVYFINNSHQEYQCCGLKIRIVPLTSWRIHILSAYLDRYSNYREGKVGD